jgi:integrator complex subunit 5
MWPNNYKTNNILTLLTNLLLKTKKNGIRMLLVLAKLADRHQWCQDLLELVLIELESIVLDEGFCLLLDDIVKDDTRQLLWRACCSAPNGKSKFNFQQQTSVRLILLQSEWLKRV